MKPIVKKYILMQLKLVEALENDTGGGWVSNEENENQKEKD